MAPPGFTVTTDGAETTVAGPSIPPLIDAAGVDDPVVAIEVATARACSEPWAAWLALPLDALLRDRGVDVTYRAYVRVDEKAWRGSAGLLPREVIGAATDAIREGRQLAVLWGKTQTGFTPVKPVAERLRVRMAEPEELHCEVSAGRAPDGTPLTYGRTLVGASDRRFFVASSDRPVLFVGALGAFPQARRLELDVTPPADLSCAADLVPKFAGDQAAALRLGVPRELLEEEGAIDFKTESLVVFAKPTAIQRVPPGPWSVPIDIPPPPLDCPGGLPPPPDPKSAARGSAQAKPQSLGISPASLAIGYVVRKGTPPPTKAFMLGPQRPCSPRR